MKPTKNRVFCTACQRTKMLFEQQSQADNFIRFNSRQILEETGHCPERSYYCVNCGGWHITSVVSQQIAERLDRRDQERIRALCGGSFGTTRRQKVKELREKAIDLRAKIDALLSEGNLAEINDILSGYKEVEQKCNVLLGQGPYTPKTKLLSSLLNYIKDALLQPAESRQSFIDRIADKGMVKDVFRVVANVINREQLEQVFVQMQEIDEFNDVSELQELETCCLKLIERFKGQHVSKVKKVYKTRLADIIAACASRLPQPVEPETDVAEIRSIESDDTNYQAYSETLMSVISNIERIITLCHSGDYDGCEDLIDISRLLLERLGINDPSTQKLKEQLDRWQQIISESSHQN